MRNISRLIDFKPKAFTSLKNYNRQKFSQDALAGLITSIVALPLAIAFGIASGVTPEAGIVTAIVAGFIISFLGGSKVQIGGPVGAFVVLTYGIVSNPEYGMKGLVIATILAGILLILMGLFKLGTVIKFIPYPIIVGFTAGIALTIFTNEIGDIFGLKQWVDDPATGELVIDPDTGCALMAPLQTPANFIGKWICYFQHLEFFNLWNFVVTVCSILIIIYLPRLLAKVKVLNKIPGSLYAIIIMTLVVVFLRNLGFEGFDGIDTIGDRYDIEAKLPAPVIPEITWNMVHDLMPISFTIAILCAIESLLSAAVADGMIGDRHSSNTELIAQGIANVICPMFGGIPATGAITRTMTNVNNGGRTPVAGMVHSVVLLLILLFVIPVAHFIPMACAAGILVVVAYNMSGWRTCRSLLRNKKSDVSQLVVTFLLTVIFDLTIALEFGVILAALLLFRRLAHTSHISLMKGEMSLSEDAVLSPDHVDNLDIPDNIQVYEIDGPFFFGIANKFDEMAGSTTFQNGVKPKVRIIRLRKVSFVDATALHNLELLVDSTQTDGVHVVLSGVRPGVMRVLKRTSLYTHIGEENIFDNITAALDRAKELARD